MARAVIFCMGCKRHMHRAKKLCKEVQKDSANVKEMPSRENKGEKEGFVRFAQNVCKIT